MSTASPELAQPPSSFYYWLSCQLGRSDEVGYLAENVSRDKTFPRTAQQLHIFLHYYDLEPRLRNTVKKAHAEWRELRQEMRRDYANGK